MDSRVPSDSVRLNLSIFFQIQENGQRKLGPPPNYVGEVPSKGCEVFVGKIPRDLFEDEIFPVFEQIGQIYELRLMMDFDGRNRGFCFVTFTKKSHARQAISKLNNFEIRKGRTLGVCSSVDNCRLFVGGIPKSRKKEEILQEIRKGTVQNIFTKTMFFFEIMLKLSKIYKNLKNFKNFY